MKKNPALQPLFLLVLLFVGCASQPKVLPQDQLVAQRIIEVGKTQDQLFVASMDWLTRAFVSSKSVIEYQDKGGGIIVGNGNMDVKYGLGVPIRTKFMITIEVKDKKARIRLDRVYSANTFDGKPIEVPVNNEFSWTQCFLPAANKLFDSYEASIKANSEW